MRFNSSKRAERHLHSNQGSTGDKGENNKQGKWSWKVLRTDLTRKINGGGKSYLSSRIAGHPHPLLLSHCWGTATSYSITPPGEEQGVYIACINLLMNIFQARCFRFPAWKSLHSQKLFALVLLHQGLSRKWRYYPSFTVAMTNSILMLWHWSQECCRAMYAWTAKWEGK